MKGVSKQRSRREGAAAGPPKQAEARRRCGLCGKARKLTRTECCGNWICDDESNYVLFSYARNSCSRNHRRYTLCGFHHSEGHPGNWKECVRCREDITTEMYVYNGMNEYNFEKLEDPPAFEPTKCATCGSVIVLSEGGYSVKRGECFCGRCTETDYRRGPGRTA